MHNQPGALSAAELAYQAWRDGRFLPEEVKVAWFAGYAAGNQRIIQEQSEQPTRQTIPSNETSSHRW